jgi:Ribbon-helix-helix protein, copG family.
MTEEEKKRMGRPPVEKPKKTTSFKLDVSDIEHLEKYSKQENISKSEAVRRGISKLKLK